MSRKGEITGTVFPTHVKIEDDGCGFEADDAFRARHFGLARMREGAESAGGWLKIQSGVEKGATVEYWLSGGNVRPA